MGPWINSCLELWIQIKGFPTFLKDFWFQQFSLNHQLLGLGTLLEQVLYTSSSKCLVTHQPEWQSWKYERGVWTGFLLHFLYLFIDFSTVDKVAIVQATGSPQCSGFPSRFRVPLKIQGSPQDSGFPSSFGTFSAALRGTLRDWGIFFENPIFLSRSYWPVWYQPIIPYWSHVLVNNSFLTGSVSLNNSLLISIFNVPVSVSYSQVMYLWVVSYSQALYLWGASYSLYLWITSSVVSISLEHPMHNN